MTLTAEVHGEGRPLICLPWFSLAGSVSAAALEPAFAGRSGWQRRYLNLPGHGTTPPGPSTADELADLIGSGIAEPTFRLAGFSGGGYLAAALARRMPERVEALLLVCHGTRIRTEDRDLPADDRPPPPPGWLDDVPAELRNHLTEAIGRRTREVAARVAAAVGPGMSRHTGYLDRLRADGYPLTDETSTLPYAGPTAIITGRDDVVCGYADQYRALAAYPRAGFSIVAGAGHYLPFERPEVFTALVRDWLDS